MYIGFDYGTSNSSIAVSGDGRIATPVPFSHGGLWDKSVIFCESDGSPLVFGNKAMDQYYETGMDGRLLKSIKGFLSSSIDKVFLPQGRFTIDELVSFYLRYLCSVVSERFGEECDRVVVGRPVMFHENPKRNELAFARLQRATALAGISEVAFQFEPIAAALSYEREVTEDECVFIADLGGGTSDFAIVQVGPEKGMVDRAKDVVATSGFPLAGNSIDSAIMKHCLLEFFGEGMQYNLSPGLPLSDWRPSLLNSITDLSGIVFLRDRETLDYLNRMPSRVTRREAIRRMKELIFDDIAYSFFQAIERAKIALSRQQEVLFVFEELSDPIRKVITQDDLRRATVYMEKRLKKETAHLLQAASLKEDDIQTVFLTGGTSQIPFIVEVFESAFPHATIVKGDPHISVSNGAALSYDLLT